MAKTLLVLCSGVLLGGCSSVPVKTVDYRGWEAVQLDNGVARAVIVPGVARVMVFERAGGANLIWQDKALWGIPANLATGDWQLAHSAYGMCGPVTLNSSLRSSWTIPGMCGAPTHPTAPPSTR